MSLPRIMVVRGDSLSSRAIEGFGGGRWSHMANVMADGSVWDSRDDYIKFDGEVFAPGVRNRPLGYLKEQNKEWAIFEAPPTFSPVYGLWQSALVSQVGKPYDEVGIKDFVIGVFTGKYSDYNFAPTRPNYSKAWFCDEYAVWAAGISGLLPWPLPLPIYTLTPGSALNLFIGAGWILREHVGEP